MNIFTYVYFILGTSESIQSVQWFRNNPKLFACGMNTKHLRLYDTRGTAQKCIKIFYSVDLFTSLRLSPV